LVIEAICAVHASGKTGHGRACPGHPRLANAKKGVDARHKAGHDNS
jgi:hypothetical protein